MADLGEEMCIEVEAQMQILGIFFEVAMTFSARASMSSAAKARGKREDPFARS